MKNFIEKIKDFLYDAIDFVLIFVIIVAVAGVIGWRLDILFAKDMDKPAAEHITDNNEVNENIINEDNDSDDKDSEDLVTENPENSNDTADDNKDIQNNNNNASSETDISNEQDNSTSDTQDVQQDEIVTVKIPNGSLPPTIANILLEKGLISNKMDFLKKSQELKLDTKLKSGEYQIKRNSSLETIIKELSK